MSGWPWGKRHDDEELDRELAAHLELEAEERREAGLEPDAARSAARRDLGNVTHVKESVHAMRPLASLERWWKDLRYAARSLAHNPGFAFVAILSLALGIGAVTAIFTIADQALLRVLPVKDPDRLALLTWRGSFIGGATDGWAESFSYPFFREMEEAKPAELSGLAARFQTSAAVDAGEGVERANVELVSGEYFSVLGVQAALGRTLLPEDDDEPDAEPWAVVAYDYWRDRLGAEPSAVGRTIRINGYPMTVVGVAPPGFVGFERLRPADLFVSFQMNAAVRPTYDHRTRRDSIWLNVFGRLAPGVDPRQAAATLAPAYSAVLRRDLEEHPRNAETAEKYVGNRLELVDAAQGLGNIRELVAQPLHILLAMVGLLLLITCVNVATLLVIRAAKREKEIALRCSLGASRWTVMRGVLLESLLLAAGGAALGLVFAQLGSTLLVRLIPAERLGLVFETTPDWRALSFTAAVALLTALLFALAPALQSTRAAAASALKNEAASASLSRAQTRLRRGLVIGQVALSLMLLGVAGLFGKSLDRIFQTDPGVAVNRLLAFAIVPAEQRYEPARSLQLATDLQRRLQLIPGVTSASAANTPMLAGANGQNTMAVEGYQPEQGEDMQAGANHVLPGFFATLGVPLLAGRDFDERDAAGAPAVIIINETFARRFFGSPTEAVGRRVGSFLDKPPLPYEVVGVVADHKGVDLREEEFPRTYWPLLQANKPDYMGFYVSTPGDPAALIPAVQDAVHEIDPSLPVFGVKTLRRQVEETHFMENLFAQLSAVFAALATLIAGVGLYGVAAFSVARRTREIGIRMALGQPRGGIFKLVLSEGLLLAAIGILVGAPLAVGAARLVGSQLYGVSPVDLNVAAAAVGALLAVAALAGYAPARRATRISPSSALRCD
ncbi:MAG: FtsX-like permease family protein [Acidobacteria bacterium]|nr:FtsX-like permease family protein [Acidobacteriota bacterium]